LGIFVEVGIFYIDRDNRRGRDILQRSGKFVEVGIFYGEWGIIVEVGIFYRDWGYS
jgi:hypothetical protein